MVPDDVADRLVERWSVLHEKPGQAELRGGSAQPEEKAEVLAVGSLRADLQQADGRKEGNASIHVRKGIGRQVAVREDLRRVETKLGQQGGDFRQDPDPLRHILEVGHRRFPDRDRRKDIHAAEKCVVYGDFATD